MNEDNSFNSYYEPYDSTDSINLSRINLEESVLAQSFLFMFVALVITGITSYLTLTTGLWYAVIFNDAFFYGLLIGELVVVLIANSTISKGMLVPSALLFVAYSVINGITLSVIFIAYTGASIATVFILSAAIFGIMAVYGMVTKKDLSSVGNLCLMALIGIIAVSLVNIVFLKLEGLELVLSFIGVLLFVGLTAYDVQKIKAISRQGSSDNVTVLALYGALQLYLDFINIFLKLLRLLGKRRD